MDSPPPPLSSLFPLLPSEAYSLDCLTDRVVLALFRRLISGRIGAEWAVLVTTAGEEFSSRKKINYQSFTFFGRGSLVPRICSIFAIK